MSRKIIYFIMIFPYSFFFPFFHFSGFEKNISYKWGLRDFFVFRK